MPIDGFGGGWGPFDPMGGVGLGGAGAPRPDGVPLSFEEFVPPGGYTDSQGQHPGRGFYPFCDPNFSSAPRGSGRTKEQLETAYGRFSDAEIQRSQNNYLKLFLKPYVGPASSIVTTTERWLDPKVPADARLLLDKAKEMMQQHPQDANFVDTDKRAYRRLALIFHPDQGPQRRDANLNVNDQDLCARLYRAAFGRLGDLKQTLNIT